jgi:hypothetical protein
MAKGLSAGQAQQTTSTFNRKVPDRIQIDTTLNRQNRVQNHPFIGRHRLLNRTAVIVLLDKSHTIC